MKSKELASGDDKLYFFGNGRTSARHVCKGKGMMKKVLGTVLVVAVSGIAAVISKKVVDWAMAPRASSVASQIEEGFRRAEAQLRPTLPKKIDVATTLIDAAYSGVVMTYYYRVDSDNYDVLPTFIQLVRKSTTEAACKTEMKKTMNVGGIFRYNYSDSHSKPLGTFDVKAVDCE